MRLDPLLYDVQFDSDTGEMSFYDKEGGLIYSCVLEREEIEDDISKPLMFKAVTDDSSVALTKYGEVTNTYETSRDGVTWETYELTTTGVVVPLNRGEEIYFRCSNWSDTFSFQLNVRFKMSGKIKSYHNCASMLGAEMPKTPPTWGFGLLFHQCASLVKAPLLGVSSYSVGCFRSMFSGTQITYPPALPKGTPKERSCESMFNNCVNLVEAPVFEESPSGGSPGVRCCRSMFGSCTSLTVAPEIPFTGSLSEDCYADMFAGCSNLITPPSTLLGQASSSATSAYVRMFSGCKSLTKAPSFGEWQATATTLCAYMFFGCSSLVEPPVIPASSDSRAGTSAFEGMFKNCTSLIHPPELPYINTSEKCYKSMFEGCTSLVQTPDLLDTSIATDSCDRMFYGCSSLSRVVCRATTGLSNTASWLSGVSPTGDFYADPSASWKTGVSGIPEGWNRKSVDELFEDPNIQDDPSKPLMFYSAIRGSSVSYTKNEGNNTTNPDLEYSNDGEVWEPFPTDLTLVLDKGQSVYVRTSSDSYSPTFVSGADYTSIYKQFNTRGVIAAYHNVHSVLKKEFSSVQSPLLYRLFRYCVGLVKAPLLPATTLRDHSYDATFMLCPSLTIPPSLPATTLAKSCYAWMFRECLNLSKVVCYANDISASNCTVSWLDGVSATGDFYADPSASWSTGVSGIPEGWNVYDIADYPTT